MSSMPPSGQLQRPPWQFVLEASPHGLCLVDAIDGLVIDVNEHHARIVGLSRSELRGRRCHELVHPDDLAAEVRAASDLLSGAVDSVDRVKRWRRPDGGFVSVRSRVRLARLPGLSHRVLWVWSEEVAGHSLAMRPAGDSERAPAVASVSSAPHTAGLPSPQSAAGSAFLANISHEIRTPLAVISGLADLLVREAGDARSRRRLRQILDSAQHVLGVVDDILDLSSLESGELCLQPAPFRLGAVIDRLQRLHAGQAHEKGLAFGIDADADLRSLMVVGDELRLVQLLAKLCSNAVKFTPRGAVEVTVQALRRDDAGVHLRFVVADTGPGVPLELRARLFQPFVQADVTSARRFGGTGLGLAFVQRLVTLMNGSIRLSSEPGQGSRFEIEVWLPQAAPEAMQADTEPGADVPADLGGVRVLLAEDHPLSQEILCDLLEALGCEVCVASDGAEAVDLFRTGRPELVLMDMQMPGMDGLEATRRIRALPGGLDIPIIGLTANVSGQDRQRCLRAGMDEHLGKPVGQVPLAQAISRRLRLARRASPEPAARARPAAFAGSATPVTPAQAGSAPADATAAAADAELLAAMTALPGIRIDAPWRASTARLESLRDLLQRFVQTQAPEADLLREHIEAGRPAAARQLAHSLAGAAGMVGARAVMEQARALGQALRQGQAGPDLRAWCLQCQAEISALAAALAKLPPRSGPAAAVDVGVRAR